MASGGRNSGEGQWAQRSRLSLEIMVEEVSRRAGSWSWRVLVRCGWG